MPRTPPPPALTGVPGPRPVDVWRLVWWTERGFLHGMRHGTAGGRALSTALAVLWWPALPVLLPVQAALTARPSARYYLSPTRDAALTVVATRRGWLVEGHSCAHPGIGRGRALRALVLPELLAAADTHHVAIHTTAATSALAARYAAELPGLVDVGRGFPRGRRLRRAPA